MSSHHKIVEPSSGYKQHISDAIREKGRVVSRGIINMKINATAGPALYIAGSNPKHPPDAVKYAKVIK